MFQNGNQVKDSEHSLSGLMAGTGALLNGEATSVSLENGALIVTAEEIKVKGKLLPESFMKRLQRENLAKDA
jgi:hypothetical protein